MRSTDRVLAKAVDDGLVPGVVAAVHTSERCLYQSAFGLAGVDPAVPLTSEHVFRIASMTKLVTSVAIMTLVDEGRVDLDAPLRNYVPGFVQPEVLTAFDTDSGTYATRPANRDASIRELLSHTGGYGYWFLHEPLRLASGSEPNLFDPPFLIADPGTQFAYSTSTDVAGLLIEPVTGLPLDEFLAQRIFAPLQMRDTGYRLPSNRDRLTRVHRRSGAGFRALPLERYDHPVRGGGGLYSTVGEYSRFLRCLLRRGEIDGFRLLSEAALEEVISNQIGSLEALMQRTALAAHSNNFIFMDGSQKFGFGVMIEMIGKPGMRSPGSYGWAGIFNTYFWVDPARDLAVVLLLQLSPFASKASVELLQAFETAIYSDLDDSSAV